MKKEHIVRAAIEIIEEQAKKYDLVITDNGTGHAFDNTFWEGLKDTSNIPNVIASNDIMKIELRSFWDSPHLSIRIEEENQMEKLLVLTYSDGAYRKKTLKDDFTVEDIKKCIINELIDFSNPSEDKLICKIKDCPRILEIPCKISEEYSFKEALYGVTLNEYLNRNKREYADIATYLIERCDLKEYYHSGKFVVNEVRVDSHGDYKNCINNLYDLIDDIDKKVRTYEKADKKKDSYER